MSCSNSLGIQSLHVPLGVDCLGVLSVGLSDAYDVESSQRGTFVVPLADCLNHTNVQTKYSYNIQENQVFRLFPTGSNHYSVGKEVFNSYGRRNNENLLLDYGFAMLDNEWDYSEIVITIDICNRLLPSSEKGKSFEFTAS
jgi:hypothetical protein